MLDDGRELVGDELLVAVGRTPATGDLGLETVGLEPGKYVDVDDSMHALGGWLYACGDVTGRNLLTHMGKYQARVAGDVIAARAAGGPDDRPGHRALADDAWVPQVVFTDPQVGSVGLTERRARDRGLPVRAVTYDLGAVSGAKLLADGYTGHATLVVDTERRVVVGATFVGADDRRAAALGHRGRGRRGAAGPALARGPVVPDRQRGLAPPARNLRPLTPILV